MFYANIFVSARGIYHRTRTGFFIVTDTGGEKNKVHIQTEHLESISQFIIFIIIYHKRWHRPYILASSHKHIHLLTLQHIISKNLKSEYNVLNVLNVQCLLRFSSIFQHSVLGLQNNLWLRYCHVAHIKFVAVGIEKSVVVAVHYKCTKRAVLF